MKVPLSGTPLGGRNLAVFGGVCWFGMFPLILAVLKGIRGTIIPLTH